LGALLGFREPQRGIRGEGWEGKPRRRKLRRASPPQPMSKGRVSSVTARTAGERGANERRTKHAAEV